MKKSIIIALLGIGVGSIVSSYGQGTVLFKNYYSSSQSWGISYGSGAASGMYAGPEISAELFYGASTAANYSQLTGLSSSITPVGLGIVSAPGSLGTGAGWFDGGSPTVPGTAGSSYAFAIYAFGTYQGVSYSGWSPIGVGTTQSGLSTTPDLPTSVYQANIQLAPVPEPSTLALAGLGGLGMLLAFRRKKVDA